MPSLSGEPAPASMAVDLRCQALLEASAVEHRLPSLYVPETHPLGRLHSRHSSLDGPYHAGRARDAVRKAASARE